MAYVTSHPGASVNGHLQATPQLDLVPYPAQVMKYLVSCRPCGSWTLCQVLTSCLSKPHLASLHFTSSPGSQATSFLQATQQLEAVQKVMKGPVQEAQRGLSGFTDQLFHKDQKVKQQTGWVVTTWQWRGFGHTVTS